MAIKIDKKTGYSLGQLVKFFNPFNGVTALSRSLKVR